MSFMRVLRATAAVLAAMVVAACGGASPVASVSSPSASSPASSPSPTAVSTDARLVIQDYAHNQVRLARLDATDVAAVTGQFDGIVNGQVIVVNGTHLLALSHAGTVTTLGQLAGPPSWTGPSTVAVSPNLSQWIYTVTDDSWTSQIHIGTSTSDRVLATVPSPDGNRFYQAFVWNTSGTYMVVQATGLGGVGPFLEYHFPLARLDVSSGRVTVVTPQCVAEQVLDDGTMLCRNSTGGVEVRPPSGAPHVIQVSTSTSAGAGSVFSRLTLTADRRHIVAARNGSSDPNLINYQMVAADLSSTRAAAFGPMDFYPDTWLPDGRLIADHLCWNFQGDGGSCDQSLDGTYIISGDGKSQTLFYKMAQGAAVVGVI